MMPEAGGDFYGRRKGKITSENVLLVLELLKSVWVGLAWLFLRLYSSSRNVCGCGRYLSHLHFFAISFFADVSQLVLQKPLSSCNNLLAPGNC